MKKSFQQALLTIAFLSIATGMNAGEPTASGGLGDPKSTVPIPLENRESPWQFVIEPYAWTTGLDGTTGVGGFQTDVSESFGDILDYLKMAAAMRVEARYHRWGILADGFYAELEPGGNPPGPLYSGVDATLKQVIAELALTYRIVEGPVGFIDVYGGIRYNYMSLDLSATVNGAGVERVSDQISSAVVSAVSSKVRSVAQQEIAKIHAAVAADREALRSVALENVKSRAAQTISRELKREILEIRQLVPNDIARIHIQRTLRAVAKEQAELAEATAEAKLAGVVETLEANARARVSQAQARARARVSNAEKKLAKAIEKKLLEVLPTEASGDTQWVDPIIGLRGQWNINERFFLAGSADIGGFGVASDLTWQLQGTLGYNFSRNWFTEIGYRCLVTDYTSGELSYDMVQSGAFLSVGYKF